jgi:transcriptional regulator with XRE-family HTH domain
MAAMTTDIRVLFGKRVHDYRKAHMMTQVEFARRVPMDRSYLSEMETGQKDPSLTVIKRIAEMLGITLVHLLDGL